MPGVGNLYTHLTLQTFIKLPSWNEYHEFLTPWVLTARGWETVPLRFHKEIEMGLFALVL